MRILDLFCKAGGASVGLRRAFPEAEITGVDIEPQPNYPYRFIRGDALTFPLGGFDFIWASPPCQAHTALKGAAWNKEAYKKKHLDLIPATRSRLIESGTPYIIENVIGAPLINPVILCGSHFGLNDGRGHGLQRHRQFECSFPASAPAKCAHGTKTIGIFGSKARNTAAEKQHYSKPKETRGPPPPEILLTLKDAQSAMDLPHMNMRELSQAIPPAYSEYLAKLFRATTAPKESANGND